jgi:hypothetical protein
MEIVKIISEHKKIPKSKPVKRDEKRVEATVKDTPNSAIRTRHIDIKK